MATTTNLEAEHWTALQAQPEVPVNESFDVFDAAVTGTLTHNMSTDADYTLVTTGAKPQEWMYSRLSITDTGAVLTAGREIVAPKNNKHYVFENATAYNMTFSASAGQADIVIEAGRERLVRCNGSAIVSEESRVFHESEFRGYMETRIDDATATGALTLSCASANVHNLTLTGNVSVVFTDVPSTGSTVFTTTVFVTQDGGGANSMFVQGAIYASGQASTVSQAGSSKDIWIFTTKDAGTTWYGMAAGLDFK
jgi:hypothetical protein